MMPARYKIFIAVKYCGHHRSPHRGVRNPKTLRFQESPIPYSLFPILDFPSFAGRSFLPLNCSIIFYSLQGYGCYFYDIVKYKYLIIHSPQGFSGINYNTGWGTLPECLGAVDK